MSITMKEIARLAGVSRQAVSAVFNNPSGCRIPQATQERIRQVASLHGYVPNAMARSLSGVSSRTVGIISSDPYFGVTPSLFQELTALFRGKGIDVTFRIIDTRPENPAIEVRELENKGVDGIITVDTVLDRKYFAVPNVAINKTGNFDVGCSRYHGTYMAAEHLINHGRKRIACLVVALHNVPERPDGWRQACIDTLGECDESLLIYGEDFQYDYDLLAEMVKERHIDGICTQNDYVAGSVIQELMRRNIRVPEDVAVMGFDGSSFCKFCTVPLATVITPMRKQAQIAVDLLLQRIKAKEVNAPYAGIAVEPILHTSQSCGCPESKPNPFYKINTFQSIELDAYENHGFNI